MNVLQKLCITSMVLSVGSAFGMHFLSSFANGARQAVLSRPGMVGGFLGGAMLACTRYYATRNNNPQVVWWKRMLTGGEHFDYTGWFNKAVQSKKYIDFINSASLDISYKFPDNKDDKVWAAWVKSVENLEKPLYKNKCLIRDFVGADELRGGTFSIQDVSLAELKKAVQESLTPITSKNQVQLSPCPEIIKQMITDRCEEARLGRVVNVIDVENRVCGSDWEKFYAQKFVLPYLKSCTVGAACGVALKYALRR
jgi:hypothetical protein